LDPFCSFSFFSLFSSRTNDTCTHKKRKKPLCVLFLSKADDGGSPVLMVFDVPSLLLIKIPPKKKERDAALLLSLSE